MTAEKFVWYELLTSDIDAALAFYGPLMGWTGQDFPVGEGRYAVVTAGGAGVGGVMALPPGMPRPFWLGYIGTPDIDAAVEKFTGAGGVVYRGPWEIPGVGRLAVLGDPQGAGLAMIQGESEMPNQAFSPGKPGHGTWHELHTTDPDAALAFYAGQFGWALEHTMDMGPMGSYQIFEIGGVQAGGIMKAAGPMPPNWVYYFGTASVSDAVAYIKAHGGTVLNGPMEVPGGLFVAVATDPQGATFAVVGPSGTA